MIVQFREVEINSFVYEAGKSDDGQPFIAEAYEVQVTKPNGQRWVHPQAFFGCKAECDEEGWPHFADLRAEALRRALKLRRCVRRAGQFDENVWREGRPVYGSPAYSSEAEIEIERQEEEAFF